ncbi:MAG TPA: GNAT family N-acetyltransferase [Solirubrobacterales bacterium]|nr:GNAT family N-acetyltransferase [Solirubrobacterales bacterium]
MSRDEPTIRPAREDEVEVVLRLYEALFESPGSRPESWDEEHAAGALGAAIRSKDSAVLVAERDGRLVGVCTAYIDLDSVRFGRRCWVEDLAVARGSRSLGVGAALLAEARRWAKRSGATHLELDTAEPRTDAQRFYEREHPSWRSISYAWRL